MIFSIHDRYISINFQMFKPSMYQKLVRPFSAAAESVKGFSLGQCTLVILTNIMNINECK